MKPIAQTAIIYQLLLPLFVASALFIGFTALPLVASAQVTVQTQQILPVGGAACPQVVATSFTPFIYDGSLHSFEFTLSDASYVAIAGSVGDTLIPFHRMIRKPATIGVRYHIDLPSTPVIGTLPIKVTLLSARGQGMPVCASIVSMSIGSGPIVRTPAPRAAAPPSTVYAPPARPSQTAKKPVVVAPVKTTATTSGGVGATSPWVAPGATSAAPTVSTAFATAQNALRAVCATPVAAYRLWLVLLVLYALIVGVALWAEYPQALSWAQAPERIATIILVLLLLLLGFWYFAVSCRAALWMPLLAFLIALLGLLAAFRNHPRISQFLIVQDTNP